jgi:hypothetical protein
MCSILFVNHRFAVRAYHNPALGSGARRANHAPPSCSGGASLRLTKGEPPRRRRRRAVGHQPMAVLKCATVAPSPKVDQHQERGARVDARGNGGEARTSGDPCAPSRAMSAPASSKREHRSPRSRPRPTVHRNGQAGVTHERPGDRETEAGHAHHAHRDVPRGQATSIRAVSSKGSSRIFDTFSGDGRAGSRDQQVAKNGPCTRRTLHDAPDVAI